MKWALYGLLNKWIRRRRGLGMESFPRIFKMRLFSKRLLMCEENGM
jgi:hypothetical protein